jgi:glucuronokinase
VIQVYEGLVYMDFAKETMQQQHGLWCGVYPPLDPATLPPLYVAHRDDASEPTEIFHNDLRARFLRGEPAVVEALSRCAELAALAREAIVAGDTERLGKLIDANFDQRRSICRLPAAHVEMVDRARQCGASANFAGSGGATVGICPDDATFARLKQSLGALGCRVARLTFPPA